MKGINMTSEANRLVAAQVDPSVPMFVGPGGAQATIGADGFIVTKAGGGLRPGDWMDPTEATPANDPGRLHLDN